MDKKKELVKNTFIITVGKICTQFISFFLLPLYTALLTTEEYGIVDLIQTYIQLILPIIMLQIDQAVFRFLVDNRNKEMEKTKIISTSVFFLIIQSVFLTAIFFCIRQFLDGAYKEFLLLNVLAMMFSNMLLQMLRGLGNNKEYSISSFLCALINIGLNILFVVGFKWGATGMLASIFFSNIICGIYIVIKMKLYRYVSKGNICIDYFKKMAKYSIPLIPNALSWWIVNSADRTIVASYLGTSSNGILSVAYKFSNIFISFYNIFSMSWTESASLHRKDSDAESFFSQIINSAFCVFSSIALLIIGVMPFVFNIIINIEFKDSYYQIPLLLIASVLNVIVGLYGSIYIAFKKTNEIAKTSIYAGIINIVVNLILIRYIGLYAASVSSICAYLAMVVYRNIDSKKYIRIKWNMKNILIITLGFGVILIAYYSENVLLQLTAFLVSILFAVYINNEIVKKVVHYFTKKLKRHDHNNI